MNALQYLETLLEGGNGRATIRGNFSHLREFSKRRKILQDFILANARPTDAEEGIGGPVKRGYFLAALEATGLSVTLRKLKADQSLGSGLTRIV